MNAFELQIFQKFKILLNNKIVFTLMLDDCYLVAKLIITLTSIWDCLHLISEESIDMIFIFSRLD